MARSNTFTLSGAECVVALSALGFEIVRREPGRTIMRTRGRIVVIPDLLVLPSTMLDAILASAEVSALEFFRYVEEMPTEPELAVLEI